MWFLTKVWIPFWLLVALSVYQTETHVPLAKQGALSLFMFGYGGIAASITLIYVATRVFRRASRDSHPIR